MYVQPSRSFTADMPATSCDATLCARAAEAEKAHEERAKSQLLAMRTASSSLSPLTWTAVAAVLAAAHNGASIACNGIEQEDLPLDLISMKYYIHAMIRERKDYTRKY